MKSISCIQSARIFLAAACTVFFVAVFAPETSFAQPYPDSQAITQVQFNGTHERFARGSDNWPITWADDGKQYTSWGDGGGFDGSNSDGRVSLGVASVDGPNPGYTGHNIWGGKDPDVQATFGGKSYGIISIDAILYMWVAPGSGATNYSQQTLYYSTDHARSWTSAGWSFDQSQGVVLPTFAQFGQDYAGARDDYVYIYAIRLKDSHDLVVQKPGQIDLFRVDKSQILQRNSYEFFSGMDANGNPTWTSQLSARQPVFEDSNGVGWNVSVSYNPGLGRYLLCTEHTTTNHGNLGIFDAPEPWGPWTTVGYYSNWKSFGSTFFWNFSNKWLSADGKDFTLVFTGTDRDGNNDSWNTVRGTFTVATLLDAPSDLSASAVSESQISLSWTDNSDNEDGFVIQSRVDNGPVDPPTVTLQAYAGSNTAPSMEAVGSPNSFKSGALVVNDRSDTWTAVPAALDSQARLLTARDDRMTNPISSMYTLDVSGPGYVFVPLDPRYGAGKLSWMDSSWIDSGMICNSSAQAGWKIWKKEIPAGQLVLGVDDAQYDGVTFIFTGPDGNPWSEIATVDADEANYNDEGLSPATNYQYRVRAFQGSTNSSWSNVASATTQDHQEDEEGVDGDGSNGTEEEPGPDADAGLGDVSSGDDAGSGDDTGLDANSNSDDDVGPDDGLGTDKEIVLESGGCACRSDGSGDTSRWMLFLLVALLFFGVRRYSRS